MTRAVSLTHLRRRHIGVWLVALIAFAAALVSPLSAESARSAGPGLIAFTRYDGIYVMRPDRSGVRPLRRGGPAAGAVGLAWSPDGRRLAFVGSRLRAIWVMDANGGGLARLAAASKQSGDFFYSVTWSTDGSTIAYTAKNGRTRDIWRMDADGADRRPLVATAETWELEVGWSPVRDSVAFTDARGMVLTVGVMDATGKRIRNVSPGWPNVQAAMPSWSPDGRRLALVRFSQLRGRGGDAEIWVTNLRGSLRRLTRNTVTDSNPAWSPDGRRIAFVRGREGQLLFSGPPRRSAGEIYVMNADGTGVTRLTHNRVGEGSLAWQPIAAP